MLSTGPKLAVQTFCGGFSRIGADQEKEKFLIRADSRLTHFFLSVSEIIRSSAMFA